MRPVGGVWAALLLAPLLGACGSGDPASSSVHTPAPAPSPHRDASPAGQGQTPAPSAGPSPRTTSQRVLDERLRAAAWAGDVVGARRLIRQGADVNAKDDTEQSAYLIATSEGHLDLLRLSLRHGARVNDKDGWNGTGLIRAAERGHALVVGELLRAGIDPDHVNRIGYQAIHEAVWLGADTPAYATTVRVLAAGGVELGRRSPTAGLTPLQMAHARGYSQLAGILARLTTADTPAEPDDALLRAARGGDADAVAVALRAGADIEARDQYGRTAVRLAAGGRRGAVAELLAASGAHLVGSAVASRS